ncbi:MAG: SPFH domain-containing protein [Fusicatenibacter sp.]|nr:SPFH domain-containing protein [Lachnospiraceae bacterium]MDY2937060.1 SPFH domain-containing protein [Fusicatenibacter sp.]
MGIIKAAVQAMSGGLSDQWLETIEPYEMGEHTVLTEGIQVRRGQNKKGTAQTVSNGSVIRVYDNQFMMLVDGGKIVDYTAQPGYYTVDNSSLPSMFDGDLGGAVKETFDRLRFGGQTPRNQKVYYVNLQEIKGIKFGTRNPVNYFDSFYNAELFLRAHGTYSIRITDPIRFYAEAVPRNASRVEIEDINEQYMNEFLEGLQASINQMSADGIRISYVPSKSVELSRYMADAMDESWRSMRGMEIQSVAIASISYDEESKNLIHMRNQGAMMSDPSVREGYVQGAFARSMEKAAANSNGAMTGFMGMNMGMNMQGAAMNTTSAVNLSQMQMNQQKEAAARAEKEQQTGVWKCSCGAENTGNFCCNCGSKKPAAKETWKCSCGAENTGNFCSNCGAKRPENTAWKCSCGTQNEGKFCSNCGKPRP